LRPAALGCHSDAGVLGVAGGGLTADGDQSREDLHPSRKDFSGFLVDAAGLDLAADGRRADADEDEPAVKGLGADAVTIRTSTSGNTRPLRRRRSSSVSTVAPRAGGAMTAAGLVSGIPRAWITRVPRLSR
jgi:hypothetical protein